MPRTNDDHHGYGGDGASYEAPRWCCECYAALVWPEPQLQHAGRHIADRAARLAAEDAAHAEVVRAIDRDRDMRRRKDR